MQLPGSAISNPDSSGGGGLTPTQQGDAWRGQWGYRIKAATSVRIDLETVGPNSVVGGTVIPAGITTFWDISAMNIMGSTGADSGNPIVGSDLYYVYWCEDGPFSPGLGFSLSAPQLIAGQLLLGNATDPTQFLFLGWIQTDTGSPSVTDSLQRRHIVNWWHRRPTPIAVVPNYVNNNAATTYSRTAGNWTTMTATAADSQISFVANGEDAVILNGSWACFQDTVQPVFGGIGRTTTSPLQTATIPPEALGGTFASCACAYTFTPAAPAALETVSLLCYTSAVAIAFVADWARTGAGADPPATSLRGIIQA